VVAGAFTIGCRSLDSEAKIRLVGLYFQVGGIIAIVFKLMEARQLFPPQTSFWQRLFNWFFPTKIEAVMRASEQGDRVSMRLRGSPSPDTPLSERVDLLEKHCANLFDEVGRLQGRIENSEQRFHAERAARETADRDIKQTLETATVGSLRLDYAGVAAVIIGTILQGASQEIANLVRGLPL
jgi:hypothetical protein